MESTQSAGSEKKSSAPTSKPEQDWKGMLGQLDKFLEDIFAKKMPAFPKGLKDFIVKVAPYLVIIGLIFSAFGLLSLFGLSMTFSYLPAMAVYGGKFFLSIIFSIIGMVLNALALPGLFTRKISGWNFIFYSILVSSIFSILTLNIFGLIIGTGLGLWIIYQVKSYYK